MIDIIYSLLRAMAHVVGAEQVLVDSWESIRDFLELGGNVLFLIGGLLVVLWTLMLERLIYFYSGHRKLVQAVLSDWESRRERHSWHAHRIREAMIAEVKMALQKNLPLIQALVALCPLLGLLGTVTGMVGVFEVIAVSGTGNARAMASGVSKATIPTMAGMVAALSGLFLSVWLQRKAEREVELLGEHMTMDH